MTEWLFSRFGFVIDSQNKFQIIQRILGFGWNISKRAAISLYVCLPPTMTSAPWHYHGDTTFIVFYSPLALFFYSKVFALPSPFSRFLSLIRSCCAVSSALNFWRFYSSSFFRTLELMTVTPSVSDEEAFFASVSFGFVSFARKFVVGILILQ